MLPRTPALSHRAGFALLVAAFLGASDANAQAPERRPSQPVFGYEYDVKLICGVQRNPADLKLAIGAYGTVINLWNPHGAPVNAAIALALTYPPEELEAGTVRTFETLTVPPRRAVAVDCRAIQALYFGYGFPTSAIKGVVSIEVLQPLSVTAVWTSATPGHGKAADELTSLDVDHIEPHVFEAELRDPNWNPDADAEDQVCDALRRTSTIVTGRVEGITYTYDEAPDEGAREVVRFGDIEVIAGNGGVVGGPVLLRMRRGILPDGSFLDVSEMPSFTIGRRYVLLLPNHTWLVMPVGAATTFRIETVGERDILVDQEGLGVTDIFGGRLVDPVSTPEEDEGPPTLVLDDEAAADLAPTVDGFLAELLSFAQTCEGPVLQGPYAAYPLVPATIFGSDP